MKNIINKINWHESSDIVAVAQIWAHDNKAEYEEWKGNYEDPEEDIFFGSNAMEWCGRGLERWGFSEEEIGDFFMDILNRCGGRFFHSGYCSRDRFGVMEFIMSM